MQADNVCAGCLSSVTLSLTNYRLPHSAACGSCFSLCHSIISSGPGNSMLLIIAYHITQLTTATRLHIPNNYIPAIHSE